MDVSTISFSSTTSPPTHQCSNDTLTNNATPPGNAMSPCITCPECNNKFCLSAVSGVENALKVYPSSKHAPGSNKANTASFHTKWSPSTPTTKPSHYTCNPHTSTTHQKPLSKCWSSPTLSTASTLASPPTLHGSPRGSSKPAGTGPAPASKKGNDASVAKRRAKDDAPRICLGRVANLESNVPAQWWTQIFSDAIYLQTDGDVVEDPQITKSEVDLLESYAFLSHLFKRGSAGSTDPAPRILDLCCGQGRHSLELARRYPKLQLCGHDQSQYLIELARERARQIGVQERTQFTVGDCRSIPYANDTFDLVLILGNSFGYFSSSASDLQVLKECYRVSKAHAFIVLDLTDGEYMKKHFSPRTWEWIDDHSFVCRERALTKDQKSLVSREVITRVHQGVIRDQFYSERLYERNEVILLLEMALYTPHRPLAPSVSSATMHEGGAKKSAPSATGLLPHVEFGVTVTAAKEFSKRKEDLGMMEIRMIMLGCKLPEHSASKEHASVVASPYPTLSNPGAPSSLPSYTPSATTNTTTCSSTTSASSATPTLSSFETKAKNLALPQTEEDPCVSSPVSMPSTMSPTKLALDPLTALRKDLGEALGLHTPISTHCPKVDFPNIPHLVLILGDPSLPCMGKLNDVWNPEDLATQHALLQVVQAHWPLTNSRDAIALPACHILQGHASMLQELQAWAEEEGVLVFNLCDEGFRNEALKELHVPAFLEMLELPYSGAGPTCLGMCYDKGYVNATARMLGIATPKEVAYLPSLSTTPLEALLAQAHLAYPLFVKPIRGDNSLGIDTQSLVHGAQDLAQKLARLQAQRVTDVLIQEYLCGQEYSVGMIGNPARTYYFLPVLQVDYADLPAHLPPILGYESKWDPTSPYWTHLHYRACDLSPTELQMLHQSCAVLFERLGCCDYARFDFRKDQHGHIKLLEVNPNPGWCWDGKLARMAALAGLDYRDLIALILTVAWERCGSSRSRGSQ